MARTIITCHRPAAGRQEEAITHMRVVLATMLAHGHRTPTPPQLMRSSDGHLICVFELRDEGSVEAAHADAELQAQVASLAAVAEMRPLRVLVETSDAFGDFEAVHV